MQSDSDASSGLEDGPAACATLNNGWPERPADVEVL